MEGDDIPVNPLLRREWIKFQLRLRGTTLSAMARELGVSRQAMGQTLIRSYPKMERAIAARLDMEPGDIWPERYARGQAKTTGSKRLSSCHVKRAKHNTATRRRNRR
jgi:Ner family transcriptional regulator